MIPKIFFIIGPPGSGKGTQAALIQKKYTLTYIGTGALLRERIKIKDYTGKKMKKTLLNGWRAPTPIVFNMWMNKLEELRNKPNFRGFILDGSPRTRYEAEMIDIAMEWFGWKKYLKVIYVAISPKESRKRLLGRHRFDDTIREINERLRWYKTDVVPALAYFRKRKVLLHINGAQSVEKVFEDIVDAVQK